MADRAREYFPAFLTLMFPPGHSSYKLGRLHMYLARVVQDVVDGELSAKQCVSVPPQMGKSRLLAVRAVAWLIGHQPGIHIGLTGFSYSLLTDFVSEVNNIISLPQYQKVFPGIVAVKGKARQDRILFANGSSIVVKSCGSKLTGRRVDWLIIDDPHAGRAEAESATMRKKIIQWYFGDCVTRLSEGAKVFVIGTRWHPEDLIGTLTDAEYVQELRNQGQESQIFNVVNLPAIANHNPDMGEVCLLGRQPGESIFPEERSLSFLQAIKASIPSYEWESQYCGNPTTSGSGQVNLAKLHRIELSDVPTDIPWVRGWDLALTEEQTSDYSVGALCAYSKATEEFFIINIWRKRLAWAKLKPQLIEMAKQDKEQHNCNIMGMEAVGGFEMGLAELRSSLAGLVKIEKRNPGRGGKLMRAQDWLNAIEAGKVYLVNGPWNKDFLDELKLFPDTVHDDQEDGVSVAWECLVRKKVLLYA